MKEMYYLIQEYIRTGSSWAWVDISPPLQEIEVVIRAQHAGKYLKNIRVVRVEIEPILEYANGEYHPLIKDWSGHGKRSE